MTEYTRFEEYDSEMTLEESDERTASWIDFKDMLTEIIVESDTLKMKITTDAYECEECGGCEAKITVTKPDDNMALHVKAVCEECEAVEDYYAYIA